ncbi:UNVERIFIED_CONTAM: hypothetical protein Sindi_2746800 [Sesamum indicum]
MATSATLFASSPLRPPIAIGFGREEYDFSYGKNRHSIQQAYARDDFDKDNVTLRMTGIVTDDKREYTINVEDDHKSETCEVTLVKSSMHDCAEIVKDGLGRKPAADVILTTTDYYHDKFRNASSLTFSPKKRAPECIELKKEIEEDPIPLPDH